VLITPTNLNIFFTALDTRFWQAFSNAPTWVDQIATTYPTNTEQWLMGWIGMLDKLRVWKGPRIVRTPAPQTYGVGILPFELTEEIDEFKLEDDQHGIYGPVVAHMGEMSKKWPDYTVRDLVEGLGDFASTGAQTGTDGVSHWSTVHPVDFYDSGKGTYVNDYGASGTSINGITTGGTLSSPTAWATVWQDMAARKNESGEKIGLQPDLTMVPTTLATVGKTITQSTLFAPPVLVQLGTGNFPTAGSPAAANAPFVGAMDNPLRGQTDLMVNFDLTSAAAWYMLTTKRVVKPFGWILRKAPQLIPRTRPDDPNVFDRHAYQFGVKARGAPAWSLPWLSSRSGV
jgi:phage major head subunit gpT-like protein